MTVHDGNQGRISYPRLTGDIKITFREGNTFHGILVRCSSVGPRHSANFLEQGLICLEVARTCMEAYNAHEHVLVVCQICNILDILDMGML